MKQFGKQSGRMVQPPAAFRRLCVETPSRFRPHGLHYPAAFRRLCVETVFDLLEYQPIITSRLQAAVC